jgi:arsenical pump membrane protein
MVVLANPALPVLGVAVVLVLWRARRGGYSLGGAVAALGVPALAGLFVLSVALGVAARSGALDLGRLHSAGAGAVAGVAALATVLVNNLPASVLLSATGQLPARALLLGLNVGPNLAVTGSLAVLLWWRAARQAGARPAVRAYSRQGIVLAPLAIAAALIAGWA